MPSRIVDEIFDRVEEFTCLLGAVELNASTDWEEQFVTDLQANFKRYGPRTYLSDA